MILKIIRIRVYLYFHIRIFLSGIKIYLGRSGLKRYVSLRLNPNLVLVRCHSLGNFQSHLYVVVLQSRLSDNDV